jgi:PIN domain nuclease of toxin-antitoxin system
MRNARTGSGALTVILDAWAVMALYEGRPCAPRVARAIDEGDAAVSAINLGEVLYRLERKRGREPATHAVERLRALCRVDHPDWPTVVLAARAKAGGGISYADAFCVATAQRLRAPLWTGDPEILALAGEVQVVDLR